MPDGTRIVDRDSALAAWRAVVKKHFPAPHNPEGPVLLDTFEPNSSAYPTSGRIEEGCSRMRCMNKRQEWHADIDTVVLQIREYVKTMEAKGKAQSEKRKSVGRKSSQATDTQ